MQCFSKFSNRHPLRACSLFRSKFSPNFQPDKLTWSRISAYSTSLQTHPEPISNTHHSSHKKKFSKTSKFLITSAFLYFIYIIYKKSGITDPRHPLFPYVKNWLIPIFQLFEGSIRFLTTAYTCLVVGLEYKYYQSTLTPEEYAIKKKEIHLKSAKRFLHLFIQHSGIYIKFGQYISTMNNFLDKEWTETMIILQDKAPFVNFDEVEQMFYLDFGKRIEDVFLEFDKTPVAAASLAQVHRAKLKTGEEVAVKVQYPAVRYFFNADLYARDKFLQVVQYAFPDYNFSWIGPEFTEALQKELDFVTEKNNARRVEQYFKHRSDIHVPKVYDAESSERFLTMEYIHGEKINNRVAMERMGLSVKDCCHIALEAFAEQVFLYGFVNCDGHPGNIFVRKVNGKPQIVLLDHGLYKELGEEFRIEFCKLWRALVLKDDDFIKHYCQKLGIYDYKLYAAMVLMRGYEGASTGLGSHGTLEQWEQFKRSVEADGFKNIFNHLPNEMLLLLRTFNLLRSINYELGVPVNRFAINAKVAVKGIHLKSNMKQSFSSKIRGLFDSWYFEFKLASFLFKDWMKIQMYRMAIFLKLMEPIRLKIDEKDVDVVLSA